MFKMNALLIYFSCFLYIQLAFGATNQPHTSDSADFIFDYVKKARSSLKLTSNPNIILVTGITGGGKSTLTHYVTGNYSKMISVKPTGVGAEYRIYDGLDPDVNHTDTSTVSRTFVPELNIDEEKNVFYDCPGFADTRNETVEIATTFLIKSVIENAKNIKIVLVVNYESVADGHDRQDFDNSLARLTELVQNVTHFQNSISMVITKVPSYFIEDMKIIEVAENSIKISTTQFATDHRTFLLQKGLNESKKKIQLIDALLKRTANGDYPRISIFWRPMEAGPLDKIKKMVDGRQSIRDTILKQISYTNFDKNDFGFPLSAEAKLKITQIAQATIAQIASILNNIDSQLLSALQQKVHLIVDFHSKFDALELGLASIRKSHGNNEPATLNEWTEILKTLIRTHGISSIDMNQFNQIARHENNLNMLESIADGVNITAPVQDLIESSTAIKYQTIEHRWYSFLVQVFNFFSNYDVQKNVSPYNVTNLSDWGQISKPQGLKISAQTFSEFAKRLTHIPVDEITPTEPRLKELNDIIGITLQTPVQYTWIGETMTIKGFVGKSSDIPVTKSGKIAVKKINVYLMSTFYVEDDLNLSGIDELKIYAPKWNVRRAATFNLNGTDGVKQPLPSTPRTPGKPGAAGGNGGNFFGYANKITNGDLLTITANGGTGANGQDGTDRDEIPHYFGRLYCGAVGGGGKGGLGGHPGFYSFVHGVNDAEHVPKSVANVGSIGEDGKMPPNIGGETSCDIEDEHLCTLSNSILDGEPFEIPIYVIDGYRFNRTCSNNSIRKSTEPVPQQLPRLPLNIAAETVAYKAILVENMNNFAFKNVIEKVYKAIESNPQINQAYTVSAYAVEANPSEKRVFRLNEHIDMYPR